MRTPRTQPGPLTPLVRTAAPSDRHLPLLTSVGQGWQVPIICSSRGLPETRVQRAGMRATGMPPARAPARVASCGWAYWLMLAPCFKGQGAEAQTAGSLRLSPGDEWKEQPSRRDRGPGLRTGLTGHTVRMASPGGGWEDSDPAGLPRWEGAPGSCYLPGNGAGTCVCPARLASFGTPASWPGKRGEGMRAPRETHRQAGPTPSEPPSQ